MVFSAYGSSSILYFKGNVSSITVHNKRSPLLICCWTKGDPTNEKSIQKQFVHTGSVLQAWCAVLVASSITCYITPRQLWRRTSRRTFQGGLRHTVGRESWKSSCGGNARHIHNGHGWSIEWAVRTLRTFVSIIQSYDTISMGFMSHFMVMPALLTSTVQVVEFFRYPDEKFTRISCVSLCLVKYHTIPMTIKITTKQNIFDEHHFIPIIFYNDTICNQLLRKYVNTAKVFKPMSTCDHHQHTMSVRWWTMHRRWREKW